MFLRIDLRQLTKVYSLIEDLKEIGGRAIEISKRLKPVQATHPKSSYLLTVNQNLKFPSKQPESPPVGREDDSADKGGTAALAQA